MGILRALVENHAHPRGWLGRLVGWRLSRGNRAANVWTVSLLNLRPSDRVLEVGFGPGVAIALAAATVTEGLAAGIESSPTMLALAQRRNAQAIAAGRVDLKLGDIMALPYPDGAFDKVFAVQVLYFLPDPLAALRELRRVMKPAGRAALFLEDKAKLARSGRLLEGIYTLYTGDEVVALLREAGFAHAWYETRSFDWGQGICALGET